MTFVDLIADAREIEDVVDLVNEFLAGLKHTGQLQPLPSSVQARRISTLDDISYSFNLVTEEIKRRNAAGDDIPTVMFALHAVLETAVERLRTSYH